MKASKPARQVSFYILSVILICNLTFSKLCCIPMYHKLIIKSFPWYFVISGFQSPLGTKSSWQHCVRLSMFRGLVTALVITLLSRGQKYKKTWRALWAIYLVRICCFMPFKQKFLHFAIHSFRLCQVFTQNAITL